MNWMPEWARDDDDEYWKEQARIDDWIAKGEAGEQQEPGPVGRREWASVKEVAARHGKSEKTIRLYIKNGELKAHGDKHHPYRIHREDEKVWLNAMRGQRRERSRRTTVGQPG